MARIILAKSFGGPPAQAEDWWFLVIEDSGGGMHVEHKQVRHNPFKRLRREIGTRTYSVKDFLATTGQEPRASLRVVLKNRAVEHVGAVLSLGEGNATCGFVRLTFVSKQSVAAGVLPSPFAEAHPLGSALYFIVAPGAPGSTASVY